MRTSIVRRRDCPKAFLSRRIPNLQLHDFPIDFNRPDLLCEGYEVNTNGGDEAFSVGVVSEAEEKTGLAYAGVSNKEELEEVVTAWELLFGG